MYPPLDENTKQAYEDAKINNNLGSISTSEPISILNYYLCGSNSNKLYYGSSDYMNIYSKEMLLRTDVSQTTGSLDAQDHFNSSDIPLFIYPNSEIIGKYYIRNNTIYQIDSWLKDKDVCELDDLVTSFILGRVIGNRSSREDIAYVQKLLIKMVLLVKLTNSHMKSAEKKLYTVSKLVLQNN